MKILIAITFSAFVTFGLSSCAKETCYTCENAAVSVDCSIDICDGSVETSGTCTGIAVTTTGNDNDVIKDAYEAAGFTCTAK